MNSLISRVPSVLMRLFDGSGAKVVAALLGACDEKAPEVPVPEPTALQGV